MNAQALFSIVSQWPKEAWPKVLLGWLDDPSHGPTDSASESAVMLFESAGLRWLLSKCPEDEEMGLVNEGNVPKPIGIDIGGNNWYHGDTIIEAISSAIQATTGSNQ